jgi:uncharacterized protein YukE
MDDIRLNIEKLTTSGLAVTNHGEDVAAKHAAADGKIETASGGWQGQSAAAMAIRWAAWQKTTSTLLTRMSDHAQGLHNGAQGFSDFEAQREQEMRNLAAGAGQFPRTVDR